MREIIIHYHRADQDYEPWGIWLWPEGYGGSWVSFTAQDSFGKIARCKIPKKHKRAGFLIRGASWEKDIDQDRYIDNFIGDQAEVWLIAGDPQVYLAPPAHLRQDVRAFAQLEIVFHYRRHRGDYGGWNLWFWDNTEEGHSLEFIGQDDYGHMARLKLAQKTDGEGLGFVLRKSVFGNSWLKKDGEDRYLPFYRANAEGLLEVWLLEEDPRIYYRAEDVDCKPRLLKAFLDDLNLISVKTYLPIQPNLGEEWGFQLLNANGEVFPLKGVRPGVRGENTRSFHLQTTKPLSLQDHYYLKHSTHGKIAVSFGQVFSTAAFQNEFHYSGQDLGVSYGKQKTSFKVWSPTATKMAVVLYKTDQGGSGETIPLKKGAKGVWEGSVWGNLAGWYYNFLVTHGTETQEAVDPYARAAGVNGLRGQIVDLTKTNPVGWESVGAPRLENPVEAIIYEAHVRDFSSSPTSGIKAKGKYLGMTERATKTPCGIETGLDHLLDLGVSHVHLLPIFDFATVDEKNPDKGYNWGYDPLNYNLPEGSYATNPHDGRIRIKELKKLVQTLSKAGLGVIMDVVYNHTYHSTASSLNKLVPGYYYRLHGDGSFSNGSGCGNELADERSMVRKFIVDSVSYWAREYKLAGFRFDLMGLHHLETMQAIRRALNQVNPEILIYGEGWAAAKSTIPPEVRAMKENTPQLAGIASFGSDFRDAVKGHVFHTQEGGFIQGQGYLETVKFGITGAVWHLEIDYGQVLYSWEPWAIHPSQQVLYVEAHDNLTLWDKLLCTTDPKADRVALMKLAHALLLTSQGIAFLHAGQEFARTKGGDPNSYQSPDHVNQLNWERKGEFQGLYTYTRDLIKFRKTRPAFRMRTGDEVRKKLRFLNLDHRNMLGYVLGPHANGDCYETILVLFNPNKHPVELEIDLGPWDVLVTKEGVGVGQALDIIYGPQIVVGEQSALVLGKGGSG